MRLLRVGFAILRARFLGRKSMILTGERAPEFTLPDLRGVAVHLADLRRDRPALLIFFKAACPVCQITLPFVERLAGSGVNAVAISQDDAVTTQRFRARHGLTLPTLLDEESAGYPASNGYRVANVPSLFLVEPDGVIALSVNGFSKADLEKVAERAGCALFREGEAVPAWRPG